MVSLTHDGFIILYSLDFSKKRGVVSYFKHDLRPGRIDERVISIAVCTKNEYVLVETGDSNIMTGRFILMVTENSLVKKGKDHDMNMAIGYYYALECCGYFGKHILWVGLPNNEPDYRGTLLAQVFDFDVESGKLKELERMRVNHQESAPNRLVRLGNKFYYTGDFGKLMSLCLREN